MLYIFYCVGVIIGLITFMFIGSKMKSSKNRNDEVAISNNLNNIDEQNNGQNISDDEIEIAIGNSGILNICVGTRIEFLIGYVSTNPYKYASMIKYYYEGQELTDNSMCFNTVGEYMVDVMLGENKVGDLSVNVVDDTSLNPFRQIKDIINLSEERFVAQMFELPNCEYEIISNNVISIVDDKIMPQQTGVAEISFSLSNDGIKYTYNFMLEVVDEPEYEIIIENYEETIDVDLSMGTQLDIVYSIYPLDEYIDTDVDVVITGAEILDSNIVITSPMISIDFIELKDDIDTTSVNITIFLRCDIRVTRTICVRFVR